MYYLFKKDLLVFFMLITFVVPIYLYFEFFIVKYYCGNWYNGCQGVCSFLIAL